VNLDKTSGSPVEINMPLVLGSTTFLVSARLTSSEGMYTIVTGTGGMQQNRDALFAVDGSENDESGVGHIMRHCHPTFGQAWMSKHDNLQMKSGCKKSLLGSTMMSSPRHWSVNGYPRCRPVPSNEQSKVRCPGTGQGSSQ
jgi:hypothetical protein